jgi:hypothetical protein
MLISLQLSSKSFLLDIVEIYECILQRLATSSNLSTAIPRRPFDLLKAPAVAPRGLFVCRPGNDLTYRFPLAPGLGPAARIFRDAARLRRIGLML